MGPIYITLAPRIRGIRRWPISLHTLNKSIIGGYKLAKLHAKSLQNPSTINGKKGGYYFLSMCAQWGISSQQIIFIVSVDSVSSLYRRSIGINCPFSCCTFLNLSWALSLLILISRRFGSGLSVGTLRQFCHYTCILWSILPFKERA